MTLGVGINRDLATSNVREAFSVDDVRRLYVDHAAELRLGVARLIGPLLDPDDVLHEVFVVALKRRDALGAADSPRAWLYGVAVKLAASRRRVALAKRFLGLDDAASTASLESPSRTVEQRDASLMVERVLRALPAAKREVIVLHELQGLSGEDIAAALRIPVKTVWTRLFHARRAFAEELTRLEAIERRTSGVTGGVA